MNLKKRYIFMFVCIVALFVLYQFLWRTIIDERMAESLLTHNASQELLIIVSFYGLRIFLIGILPPLLIVWAGHRLFQGWVRRQELEQNESK